LPAYQRILRSFGSYDVVGFQTETDAGNFRDCIVSANAGRVATGDWCEIDGRRMKVSVFPIGIDTEAFAKEARAAEADRELAWLAIRSSSQPETRIRFKHLFPSI